MRRAVADENDLARLSDYLETQAFGRAHEHHAKLTSTNDRAWEWIAQGAPDGALATTEEQTAGRGRFGRDWSSPPGDDIYASLVLRSVRAPAEGRGPELSGLALAFAVGVREGILRAMAGTESALEIGLKWPNDVMVAGRKVAGILCESRWSPKGVDVVAGIGCNVHRKAFTDELSDVATSLARVASPQRAPGRARLLAGILDRLEDVIPQFLSGGFSGIRSRYEPFCTVLGRSLQLGRSCSERRVVAVALDDDGALRVRPAGGGASFRVESGDVTVVATPAS